MEHIKKSTVTPSALKLLPSGSKLRMRKKRKGFKSKLNQEDSVLFRSEFDIPGVTKLVLSPLSQKIIGCKVGENVTAEDAWIMVKKYKIEDNIDLHESSEFLPIKAYLKIYPEEDILVGFDYIESIKNDQFFVVYTLEAKKTVLKIIERQLAALNEKIRTAIYKPVRPWYTWGSEPEVDETLIKNQRPLFETEISMLFPHKKVVRLKMRKAEDARDGYVELLPDPRFQIENVTKKRIDSAVQVSPLQESSEAQTTLLYPTNQWTQYEYEYKEKTLDVPSKHTLQQFVTDRIDKLEDLLEFTTCIDLHADDYIILSNKLHSRDFRHRELNFSIFACYVDRAHCLGKFVTDCAWDPFMSGTLAICYSDSSFTALTRDPKLTMGEMYGIEETCFVLVWSYMDVISPKLFLESPRPVTALTFCPYRKDILVGGCKNGQVIIWDLTGRLAKVEKLDVYTARQLLSRATMKPLMDWFINIEDKARVKPIFVSHLHRTHTGLVSAFTWVHNTFEITAEGKHQKLENPKARSCSFVSCGLDGTLLVWDISDFKALREKVRIETKIQRLSDCKPKRPSIEIVGEQRIAKIEPIFKMVVCDERDVPFPISGLIKTTRFMNYDIVNSEGYRDPRVRTAYNLSKDQAPFVPFPFMVVTSVGKMAEIDWKGYDFKTGNALNAQRCSLYPQTIIHDGPINSCVLNKLDGQCILTVGGTCFAVWNLGDKYSLIWRKAKVGKYLFGGWAVNNPSYVIAIRSDGMLEWWDFLCSSWSPLKVVPICSNIMNLYGSMSSPHSRKSTFGVSDTTGSMIILKVPPVLTDITESEMERFNTLLNRTIAKKAGLRRFMDKMLLEMGPRTEEEKSSGKPKEELEKRRITEIMKMDRIFKGVEWKTLSEKMNFEAMLKRKELSLKELAKMRKPLQNMAREANMRRFKQQQMMNNKEKLFLTIKRQLFEQINKRKHQYHFTTKVDSIEAEFLLDEYDEVEKRALSFIHSYTHTLKETVSQNFQNNIERGMNFSVLRATSSHMRFIRRKTHQISLQKQAESSKSSSLSSNYPSRLFM